MVERRQLPPQIKRVELTRRAGGRPVVRCQLTVDVGIVDGKRKQLRKCYANEIRGPQGARRDPRRRCQGDVRAPHHDHSRQGNRGLALVPPRHQGQVNPAMPACSHRCAPSWDISPSKSSPTATSTNSSSACATARWPARKGKGDVVNGGLGRATTCSSLSQIFKQLVK